MLVARHSDTTIVRRKMTDKLKYILTIFTFHICCLTTIGQTIQASKTHKIDSIINGYLMTNKMVGVSIGIVKNGEIIFIKGYGTTEIGNSITVDSLTNFLTCSITKLFTATAIMQLSEQGKIDIEKKLVYYLPDLKMKDERYKDITITHLLTHTSGLPWDIDLKNSPNDSSALRKLIYSLNSKSLSFAPGTKFNPTETYSNVAYDILGYLVQKISRQPYQDYILDSILVKANMTHSSIDYNFIPTKRRSSPHILKGDKVKIGGIRTENLEHSPSGNYNLAPLTYVIG
jgi:CubicO group peptidase (beta-lactamase class C family)